MKLTRELALDKTIKVWEERAESGGFEPRKCYLCVYDPSDGCDTCPWKQYMGYCCEPDSPFYEWTGAETPRSRRTWATRCLEILYAIREVE